MTYVEVERIPGRKVYNNSLITYLNEFMSTNIKTAKVVLDKGDYKNYKTAYGCISTAVRKYGYPIKVHRRDGEIFLERTDI